MNSETYSFFQSKGGEDNRAKICTRKRLQQNKGARADFSKSCKSVTEDIFYLKKGGDLCKSQRLELASPNSYDSLCTPNFWPANRSVHVCLRMDALLSWILPRQCQFKEADYPYSCQHSQHQDQSHLWKVNLETFIIT